MLSVLRLQRVEQNVEILAGQVLDEPLDSLSAPDKYARALDKLQPIAGLTRSPHKGLVLDFLPAPPLRDLASEMLRDDEGPARQTRDLPSEAAAAFRRLWAQAWGLLKTYDAETVRVIELLICRIILVSGGSIVGTTSARRHLGVVFWGDPRRHVPPVEYADIVLHEAVHQALFLDEMLRGCFAESSEAMSAPAALAVSSVRGIKRPYHLAFHAACVDATLLEMYRALGMRKSVARLTDGLDLALPDLTARSHLLTATGAQTLDEAAAIAAAPVATAT